MAKLYALLVGINEYHPKSSVKNLKGCVNDVNAMDAFLKKNYKHLKPDIKQVLNQDATRENLIKKFRSQLSQAKAGDIAMFYYSGHGSHEKTSEEFETFDSKNQNETLVCHDSRVAGNYDLADKEIGALISELDGEAQKVLILDSCHSGSITRSAGEEKEGSMSRQEPSRGGGKRPLDSYLLKGENFYVKQKKKGMVMVPTAPHISISACSRDQKALEKDLGPENERRGLFSTHLIRVLELNKFNISYNELYTHIHISVLKEEKSQTPQIAPLYGFNPNFGFLMDKPANPKRHPVILDDGEWKLKIGQVNGILPSESEDVGDIKVKLFPKNDDKHKGIDGTISTLGLQDSTIDCDGADKTIDYEAEIIGLPKSNVMLVGLKGPKKEIAQLLKMNKEDTPAIVEDKAPTKSPYVELVDATTGMDYALEIEKDGLLSIRHLPSGLMIQGAQYPEPSLRWSLKKLIPVLEHIEKWERIKKLEKRAKVLDEKDITINLTLGKGNDAYLLPATVTDVTVDMDGEDDEIPFSISVENNSQVAEKLHVLLLYLSPEYDIQSLENKEIDKNTTIELFNNSFFHDAQLLKRVNILKEVDILKVIVSTKPLNEATFALDPLEIGKVYKGNSRGIRAAKNAKKREDWFTKSFSITISTNEKAIGKQEENINGMTFKKNDNLSAKLSFGSIRSHTRSTDPIYRLPDLLAESDLEIMDFSQTRGEGDKCIIELHDIQGEEQLVDQPLEIMLPDKMEEGEMIIPVTFDGEFILPFGEVKETADKRAMVSIDHLPAQADDGRRSVTRALKFVLLRTVFKDKFDVFKLRWVDYSVSKRRRKTDGLKEKVAGADKILLLIHGIIGDTKFMADQAEFAVQEKDFDLVLTYDYENLGTDIDVIAGKLHQDLIDVGLGSDHNKKLTIVAHSMGGLVSRHMIENIRNDDGSVEKLMMFGTPNGGSRFGLAPDFIEEKIPEKYKELVRDQAKAWYKFALGFALNLLPGYVKTILEYVVKLAKLDEIESPDILNTLSMMSPENSFIQDLIAQDKAKKTSYFIIAGDITNYESSGGWFKRFVDKIQVGVGKVVYYNIPNDIAVGTEDIRKVKGLESDFETNTAIVPGHHLNYFDNPPSVEKWKEWL